MLSEKIFLVESSCMFNKLDDNRWFDVSHLLYGEQRATKSVEPNCHVADAVTEEVLCCFLFPGAEAAHGGSLIVNLVLKVV